MTTLVLRISALAVGWACASCGGDTGETVHPTVARHPPRTVDARCLAEPPPDGVYQACNATACAASELQVAIVGGCIGFATTGALATRFEATSTTTFVIRRAAYIGGIDRGRTASYEASPRGLRVFASEFGLPHPIRPRIEHRMARVAPLSADLDALMRDPRLEVAAAALERAARDPSDAQCAAWTKLLDDHPALGDRAATLARHRCLAPALERMMSRTNTEAAPDALAALLDPTERAEVFLRLLPDAPARNTDALWRLIWTLDHLPAGFAARLEAIEARAVNSATAWLVEAALALPAGRSRTEADARRFFERAGRAGCQARGYLVSDPRAFMTLLGVSEVDVADLVIPLIERSDCPHPDRLAMFVGSRFAHRPRASNAVWSRVRTMIQRIPMLSGAVRSGLACGGSSCDEPGTCHHGDPGHPVVDRDALLASLSLPLC